MADNLLTVTDLRVEFRRRGVDPFVAVDDLSFEVRPGQMVKLGSSFGFSVFPHDGEAYETLLSTADQRMYQDKAQRKARLNAPAPQAADPNAKRPSVFAKIPRQPAADRTH